MNPCSGREITDEFYYNGNIIDGKIFPPHVSLHICTVPKDAVERVAETLGVLVAFHLGEQGEQQEGDAGHAPSLVLIGNGSASGRTPMPFSARPWTRSRTSRRVAAEPVEGGAGFLVAVDPRQGCRRRRARRVADRGFAEWVLTRVSMSEIPCTRDKRRRGEEDSTTKCTGVPVLATRGSRRRLPSLPDPQAAGRTPALGLGSPQSPHIDAGSRPSTNSSHREASSAEHSACSAVGTV
jgi:hypothetical protein